MRVHDDPVALPWRYEVGPSFSVSFDVQELLSMFARYDNVLWASRADGRNAYGSMRDMRSGVSRQRAADLLAGRKQGRCSAYWPGTSTDLILRGSLLVACNACSVCSSV